MRSRSGYRLISLRALLAFRCCWACRSAADSFGSTGHAAFPIVQADSAPSAITLRILSNSISVARRIPLGPPSTGVPRRRCPLVCASEPPLARREKRVRQAAQRTYQAGVVGGRLRTRRASAPQAGHFCPSSQRTGLRRPPRREASSFAPRHCQRCPHPLHRQISLSSAVRLRPAMVQPPSQSRHMGREGMPFTGPSRCGSGSRKAEAPRPTIRRAPQRPHFSDSAPLGCLAIWRIWAWPHSGQVRSTPKSRGRDGLVRSSLAPTSCHRRVPRRRGCSGSHFAQRQYRPSSATGLKPEMVIAALHSGQVGRFADSGVRPEPRPAAARRTAPSAPCQWAWACFLHLRSRYCPRARLNLLPARRSRLPQPGTRQVRVFGAGN